MALIDKFNFFEPMPLQVWDRNAGEFEDLLGSSCSLKVSLQDGGVVFIVLRESIFLAWHFGPDGQFVDYVERTHPPSGLSDYQWLEEVQNRGKDEEAQSDRGLAGH